MPVVDSPDLTPRDGVVVVDGAACGPEQLEALLSTNDPPIVVLRGSAAALKARKISDTYGSSVVCLPDETPPWAVEPLLEALRAQHRELGAVRDRHNRMEVELRHAQKMDAVGQLASGIAHEINTPIQFVGDSIFFLQGAFDDMQQLVDLARRELGHSPQIAQLAEEIDLDFIINEIPRAFERTRGGCDRVSTIVRAMRHFARDDHGDRGPADLVGALRSTLVVASNELKLVADVQTDLQPLPQVDCLVGDLNQVFLNLLVNAAHAIADAGDERGTITVTTRDCGDQVEIRISDTGCGISDQVSGRVFEPFFTTKEVGRGTGQGLAISHAIVVDRHGGELTFESTPGKGTTFVVKLPIEATPVLAALQ